MNKTILSIFVMAGVLAIGLILAGNNITGNVIKTDISTPFPLEARGYLGWGDCSHQSASVDDLNLWCVGHGYKRLARYDSCYHQWAPTRYLPNWNYERSTKRLDGTYTKEYNTLTKGKKVQGTGMALTRVKCER